MLQMPRLIIIITIIFGFYASAESSASTVKTVETDSIFAGQVFSTKMNSRRVQRGLSYFRFYNSDSIQSGRIRGTIYNSVTGDAVNTFVSDLIAPGQSIQISITDMETAYCSTHATFSSSREDQCSQFLNVEIVSEINGLFQHIVFSPTPGHLSNFTSCSKSTNQDTVSHVHGLIFRTNYPSTLVVEDNPKVERGSRPKSANLGFYDSTDGTFLFTHETDPIPANGTTTVKINNELFGANTCNIVPADMTPRLETSCAGDAHYYTVKLLGDLMDDGTRAPLDVGFTLDHIVVNRSGGLLASNMGAFCPLVSNIDGTEWNGVIIKDNSYPPYTKHLTSYNLIVAGLPDVTDDFLTSVGNIANRLLVNAKNTDQVRRKTLLGTFKSQKAFQRVGSTSMNSYNPPLEEANYPGWDFINDNYSLTDFIWETTCRSPQEKRIQADQINEILEHLLHTITLQFNINSSTVWGYTNPNSDLNLAMNEAINKGVFDDSSYGNNASIKAQEFAYWMILTGWDYKSIYAPDSAPEWTISSASEMASQLPLATTLFNRDVKNVLNVPGDDGVRPLDDYLKTLLFKSIFCLTSGGGM